MLSDYTFYAIDSWIHTKIDEKYLSKNVKQFNARIDINSLYEQTGILLYPTHFNEGLGRTILEAGLMGIPAVVSNNGAVPNTVGKGGIVVPNFNADEWVKAIKKIEFNYENYSKLAYENADEKAIDIIAKFKELQIL